MSRGQILLIDDDHGMVLMLTQALARRGFEATGANSAAEALDALESATFDAIVTDLEMPDRHGLDLCRELVARRPDVPVILITAFGSMETAIGGIRAGAWDFIPKPFEVDALAVALDRATQMRALRAEVRQLRAAVAASRGYADMLGESRPMARLFDQLDRVADLNVTVLVAGESGTGKELIARSLHQRSSRAKGPFIAVNCAAMPATLLESELFGHARGAFTDARAARPGLFMQANGGTLFLDEVGELPLELQPKLLRALQERRVRPVGSDHETPFDARLICATNRDLEAEVEAGRFREDLYYRIHVVHIEAPALRSRGNDVLLLAQRFLEASAARMGKRVMGVTPAAAERLAAYDWPGNVRELQNIMERAVALTRYEQITPEDLPQKILAWKPGTGQLTVGEPHELVSLDALERRYVRHVLAVTGGNKSRAARILGLDRKTLYRKLEAAEATGDEPV